MRKVDFGSKKISEITAEDCRKALSAATSRLSGTSSSIVYTITKMVFESALLDGIATANPMRHMKKPKLDTKERVALDPEELDKLWLRIEELPLDGRTMILFFAIDAGLRIGEATMLETKDIGADSFKVSHSKTKKRVLPFTDRLKKKCREWEAERERREIADAEFYCCKPSGFSYRGSNLWGWHRETIRPLGAPEHIHDLRHSNLSRMARFMSAYDLQRWAGWNSIAMAQRYVHDDYEHLVSAVQKVQNVG